MTVARSSHYSQNLIQEIIPSLPSSCHKRYQPIHRNRCTSRPIHVRGAKNSLKAHSSQWRRCRLDGKKRLCSDLSHVHKMGGPLLFPVYLHACSECSIRLFLLILSAPDLVKLFSPIFNPSLLLWKTSRSKQASKARSGNYPPITPYPLFSPFLGRIQYLSYTPFVLATQRPSS